MPLQSTKYFGDHVSGSPFNNQETLSRELRRLGKDGILETDETNPLTVRLFQAKEGHDQIKQFISSLRKDFPRWFSERGYYTGAVNLMTPLRATAASGSPGYEFFCETARNDWTQDPLTLVGVPTSVEIRASGRNSIRVFTKERLYMFYLHTGVYTFFSNLDSSLDRVRLELNSIYFDGYKNPSSNIGNRYWESYTKPNNDRVQRMRNAGLSVHNVLTGTLSVSLHQRTAKYRNRLIHDGDLSVRVDESLPAVFLVDDPDIIPPTFHTELLPFVELAFADLQNLLHDIYEGVIHDLQQATCLPLIH